MRGRGSKIIIINVANRKEQSYFSHEVVVFLWSLKEIVNCGNAGGCDNGCSKGLIIGDEHL